MNFDYEEETCSKHLANLWGCRGGGLMGEELVDVARLEGGEDTAVYSAFTVWNWAGWAGKRSQATTWDMKSRLRRSWLRSSGRFMGSKNGRFYEGKRPCF